MCDLQEKLRWKLEAGCGYYVVRGASLIAFRIGQQPLPDTGLRMIGAHTDSPGLRLKTNAAQAGDGVVRLGVEIYGGPILATFTDRDLSLAGRVNVRTAQDSAQGRTGLKHAWSTSSSRCCACPTSPST